MSVAEGGGGGHDFWMSRESQADMIDGSCRVSCLTFLFVKSTEPPRRPKTKAVSDQKADPHYLLIKRSVIHGMIIGETNKKGLIFQPLNGNSYPWSFGAEGNDDQPPT